MGLLTLTATVIDVIALYIVPNKDNYRQYVFDESPEFVEPPSTTDVSTDATKKDEVSRDSKDEKSSDETKKDQ